MANPAKTYWEVIPGELFISPTEKAGYTSQRYACARKPRHAPDRIRQTDAAVRVYLRHPIIRFASAYAYFYGNHHFPGFRQGDMNIDIFTDHVLSGAFDPHWSGQLDQHELVTEVGRLEEINATWPHEHTRRLEHMNRGRGKKPHIWYRLPELVEFYARDLECWQRIPAGKILRLP